MRIRIRIDLEDTGENQIMLAELVNEIRISLVPYVPTDREAAALGKLADAIEEAAKCPT